MGNLKSIIIGIFVLTSFIKGIGQENKSIEECARLVKVGEGESALSSLLYHYEKSCIQEQFDEDEYGFLFVLLTNILSSSGRIREAVDLCYKSLPIYKQRSDNSNSNFLRYYWKIRGQLEIELKDYTSAIHFLQESQRLYEEESIYEEGYFSILASIGRCYLLKNDIAMSILYLEEAKEIHETYIGKLDESSFVDTFQLINDLGMLSKEIGDYINAEKYFNIIIANIPEDSQLSNLRAIACNNLAIIYTLLERYDDAKHMLSLNTIHQPQLAYGIHQNLAINSMLSHDYKAMIEHLDLSNKYALQSLQSIILNFSVSEREYSMSTYLNQVSQINNVIALFSEENAALKQGFEMNLFAKEFEADFSNIIRDSFIHPKIEKQDLNLWDEYSNNRAILTYGNLDKEEKNELINELSNQERLVLNSLNFNLEEYVPRKYSFSNIKNKLSDDEVIIDIVNLYKNDDNSLRGMIDTGYSAYCISSETETPLLMSLCKRQDILPLIYCPISDAEFINKIYLDNSYNIYKLLIEPILPVIEKKKKIYLRPIDQLSFLNFEAILLPDGKMFGEEYEVIIVSDFHMEGEKIKTYAYNDIVLFGDPNFFSESTEATSHQLLAKSSGKFSDFTRGLRGNWSRLPESKTEVEVINNLARSRMIESTIYTDLDATEGKVKLLSANSPSILHFATHGFFISTNEDSQNNEFIKNTLPGTYNNHLLLHSGLLFSGANNVWNGKTHPNPIDDGILTADEISRLNLDNTSLVVLSACDSGKGHSNGTEGLMGLPRAFKEAGVKTIVMSLWQVPDESTSKLMQHFYQHLFENHTVRQALKLAQQDLISEGFSDPYYWASFIAID